MEAFSESSVQAETTRYAMQQAGLFLNDVWMRYFSFTGAAGEYEIDAYLNGSLELPAHDRDLIAHAVNELINELPPPPTAPYSTNTTHPQHNLDAAPEDNSTQD